MRLGWRRDDETHLDAIFRSTPQVDSGLAVREGLQCFFGREKPLYNSCAIYLLLVVVKLMKIELKVLKVRLGDKRT